MPLPTITVSLGFLSGWILGDAVESLLGVSTFLALTDYQDISAPVRRFSINRGRSHELNRVEAAKAVVRVANRDGAFTADNAASPYFPHVRPLAPLRIQATYNAVTYHLFNGFLEGFPQHWTQGPEGDAYVELRAVDAFKLLNLAKVTTTRGVEGAGARIEGLLDEIGWPASLRSIDPGDSNVQAVTLQATSILSHLQEVAASEGGVLFVARDGVLTFLSRLHAILLNEALDTWGDVMGENPYEDLATAFDDENLANEVTVTAPALAAQTVRDDASIAQFGGPAGSAVPRVLTVSTLLTNTGDMLDRAEFFLSQYAFPKNRVTSLTLDTRADATQVPRILGRELHDRVLARKRPVGGGLIDQPSIVEGIGWNYLASQYLRAEWALSSTAYQQGMWELGTVGKSELGVTTTLVG